MLANILIGLVALLHAYFLVLEMFLWTKPKGLKAFRQTLAQAEATKVHAANQGLYNGFLSAGLIWGILHSQPEFGLQIKIFFLICVLVAGLYGAYSVGRQAFVFQAIPAAVALAAVLLG